MQTEIKFNRNLMAYGRNGNITQTGIDINPIGEYINIWPINSRGQVSNAALIQVPMENLDELIAKLQEIKANAQSNPES
jgi:hypothetical protein